MTLLLDALLAMTYDSIESANVDWALHRMRVLIFQRVNAFELQNFWNEATKRKAVPWGHSLSILAQNVEDVWENINSSSVIKSWRNKAQPRFMYPMLERGYRLWNMIVVSNLNSGDSDNTLTDFPLGENSKFSPKHLKACQHSDLNHHIAR